MKRTNFVYCEFRLFTFVVIVLWILTMIDFVVFELIQQNPPAKNIQIGSMEISEDSSSLQPYELDEKTDDGLVSRNDISIPNGESVLL